MALQYLLFIKVLIMCISFSFLSIHLFVGSNWSKLAIGHKTVYSFNEFNILCHPFYVCPCPHELQGCSSSRKLFAGFKDAFTCYYLLTSSSKHNKSFIEGFLD